MAISSNVSRQSAGNPGDLDRKGHEKGQEDQDLGLQGQGQLVPDQNVKTAALGIQVNNRHQREQGAQQGVEKELEGCQFHKYLNLFG